MLPAVAGEAQGSGSGPWRLCHELREDCRGAQRPPRAACTHAGPGEGKGSAFRAESEDAASGDARPLSAEQTGLSRVVKMVSFPWVIAGVLSTNL